MHLKPPLEKETQKEIISFLRLKGFYVFKVPNVGVHIGNRYIPAIGKGIADIIGVAPGGRFCAFEVKRNGGRVSPEQRTFLEEVGKRGGYAAVVYSLDDIIHAVEAIMEKV